MITLEQAIEKISQANPFMGNLLHSDEPLFDYVKNHISHHEFNSTHLERQKPYIELIKEKINKLFPNEDVKVNFTEGMILDTTDHHNILNFPTIIGAHMISRFDTILDREKYGDFFVLDTGNVTFSEVLNKRGINIGGKHINLYPKDDKNKLIGRYPLYEYDLLKLAKNSGHKFTENEIAFLKKMQGIIDKIDFSTCERLSDQIVKINYYLWQEFFADDIRDKVRKCITLEHDEILIKYLSSFLLENKTSTIYKALFDKEFRNTIRKEFDGIYGAWNYSGDDSGTDFFWCFSVDDGKRYKMKLDGEVLKNPEGKIRDVRLTPEDVSAGLKEGILIPSIFIKFGLVATYMGCKLMGGPGQTEYAGALHDAWLRVLEKHDKEELELAKQVVSTTFNTGDLAFSKNDKGEIMKEWGFDIAMNHRFNLDYIEKLKNVKFKYLLYPFIPLSYYRLAKANERQEIDYKEADLYKGFDWA